MDGPRCCCNGVLLVEPREGGTNRRDKRGGQGVSRHSRRRGRGRPTDSGCGGVQLGVQVGVAEQADGQRTGLRACSNIGLCAYIEGKEIPLFEK